MPAFCVCSHRRRHHVSRLHPVYAGSFPPVSICCKMTFAFEHCGLVLSSLHEPKLNSTAAYREPEDVSVLSGPRTFVFFIVFFCPTQDDMFCLALQSICLDGNSLTSTDLVNLGRGLYKITVSHQPNTLDGRRRSLTHFFLVGCFFGGGCQLSAEAERNVVKSRELLDTIVKENKGRDAKRVVERRAVPLKCGFRLFLLAVVYGITTGFGKFARTVIPVSKLK